MAHISDIKLIRTDTTLDLSQKAEKGMNYSVLKCLFYSERLGLCCLLSAMWDFFTSSLTPGATQPF